MAIYELSDGERSTREIAALLGLGSNATVANYWKKWNRLGIVEPSEKHQGRSRRICSLGEVGLTIPPIPHVTTETEQSQEVLDEQQGS
jgi:transposase